MQSDDHLQLLVYVIIIILYLKDKEGWKQLPYPGTRVPRLLAALATLASYASNPAAARVLNHAPPAARAHYQPAVSDAL